MAVRNSNNYKVVIVPEVSYGVQVKNLTTGVAFPDVFDWNYEPITQELKKKENSLYKSLDRDVITGKKVVGSLSGDLRDTHEILLKAHFDDASSPYLYPSQLGSTLSYNVYRLWLNAAGDCTHYDVLLGAVFNPLTFTGEPNGILQYSTTTEGTDFLENTANSDGDALSNIPAVGGTCFLFANMSGQLMNGATALNSFSLELSKTMVDDALRFQNSMSKSNDRYTQVGGTFQVQTIYDDVSDDSMQADRYDPSKTASNPSTLTFANASKTWTIVINGIVTSAENPDADRGLLLGNYTVDLREDTDADEPPITITVASV